jgi:hypothetical protein
MKIIDKTPFQDANGNISIVARTQGTLKYGLNWFSELEAQKAVIAQLDRSLEKGFVLLRNFTLPNSEIVIPMILIGTGGIWVIYVTPAKGHFEAKGDQWNIINDNGKSQPASINLIARIVQLTNVFQKYLKIQKIDVTNPVESVLIASDPGAQVESVRPAARVVRSDAIKQFASSLVQARPIWSPEYIHALADQLINPRPPSEMPVEPEPAPRANSVFTSSDESTSFNSNELGFAFDEGESQPDSQNTPEPSPVRPLARPEPTPQSQKKKAPAMSRTQIMLLAGMLIVECCILVGFGALMYFNP